MEKIEINQDSLNSILSDEEKKKTEEEKKKTEEEKENTLQKRKQMKIKAEKMSKLKLQIDNLSKSEYIEIFKIIKMNNEKFSQNKNGVMFDLMKFSNKAIDEINNFIKYIENNNLLVEHDEETRNVFRTLIN
jgi:hypothetical protein